MQVVPPTRDFVTPIEDSRRWTKVPFRASDIIISTPPKCGTTWTQRIVMSLLWPAGDAPGTRDDLSPWVDVRLRPVDDLAAELDAQTHRRFIKTHSPGDATAFSPSLKYLVVYRNPADALVSWGNHRATFRPEIIEMFNTMAAADDLEPIPLRFEGDYDELLMEWTRYWSPAIHLAPWWSKRHASNVLFLHYADMYADQAAAMAQIAEFLEIAVPQEHWEATVERCRLGAMREEARATEDLDRGFKGGADAFFHKGGNGRGVEALSEQQADRVRRHCADLLPEPACDWLDAGGPLP
jgi:aryl sulfotransferase